MSFMTYQCDGCGTTTNEQAPVGWKTVSPTGLDAVFDQRRASVPVHSHLCGTCWGGAIGAVHSRVLTAVLRQVASDTVEYAVIKDSLAATG